jgi:hypothetical protein
MKIGAAPAIYRGALSIGTMYAHAVKLLIRE